MALEAPGRLRHGRHVLAVTHLLRAWIYVAGESMAGRHQGRTSLKNMGRGVRLLPAEAAPAGPAVSVTALGALWGGVTPYSVEVGCGAGPVPGSQLVDIDRLSPLQM